MTDRNGHDLRVGDRVLLVNREALAFVVWYDGKPGAPETFRALTSRTTETYRPADLVFVERPA